MKLQNITQAIIMRLCHDLIGPMGTAQIALEAEETEILASTIEQTVLKLEMFRCFFKKEINKDQAIQLFKKYALQNELSLTINHFETTLAPLIFFITQKMLKKSSAVINEDEITLNYFFLKDEEIETLENKSTQINSSTILPFLALQHFIDTYKIKVTQQEEKLWQIKLIKN